MRFLNERVAQFFSATVLSFLFISPLKLGADSAATAGNSSSSYKLIYTPGGGGHSAFVEAINGARKNVEIAVYHLTDPKVIRALVKAANRGVNVKVILDRESLNSPKYFRVVKVLLRKHIEVRRSSSSFSIMHEKAMVVDGKTAFVTAMNLTRNETTTRDFGIITTEARIVKDVQKLFEFDFGNALRNLGGTPADLNEDLVVSPVNSRSKLVDLIHSARRAVIATSENLGDPEIMRAFINAARRGVDVKIIVPLCDKNDDPNHNFPYVQRLEARKVHLHMMPIPESEEHPYMHSKMCIADSGRAYVGSVNFSTNSTMYARELGILFSDTAAIEKMNQIFDQDWQHSIEPPAEPPKNCPTGF